MSGSMEILNRILHNLRAKYDKINQLLNFTKEMDAAINQNDSVSFGMLLDMREKVMESVDVLDKENMGLVAKLPQSLQEKTREMLAPKGGSLQLENPLEANIFDTNRRALLLLQKVASLNDTVFRKLNGA